MKKIYSTLALVLFVGGAFAQKTDRMPLIEGFTSATCGPCAGWNAAYSPILDANSPNEGVWNGVAVLKFQMDWPSPGNDPSNNDEMDTRRGFYGVTGIPDFYIDGAANDGSQGAIDASQADSAELIIQAAYTLTGNTIDVHVEFTPLANLGGGSRLYIAIANKAYNYNGPNGETEFHHVARKMLPDGAGTWLPFLDSGITQTFDEQYTYTVNANPQQDSYDFWDNQIEIVAWVQKSNSKVVWNATVAGEGTVGVAEGDDDDFGLIVYPNPATEQATIMFDADGSEAVTVEVFNNLGQLVFNEAYGSLNGQQRINLDATSLDAGMYFVKVQSGNSVATSQLLLTK